MIKQRSIISHSVDPEADAVYVRFSDAPYAFGEDIDHERRIDYSEDKTAIGVELLCVSEGVSLADLPHKDEIRDLLRSMRVSVVD